MKNTYPVFYHIGQDLTIKIKAEKGRLVFDEGFLQLTGKDGRSIEVSGITSVELFRLHGMGRVIKLDSGTERIFFAVTRLMIGQFAIVNFFATGEVFNRLIRMISK